MLLFTHIRLAHSFSNFKQRNNCILARLQAISVLGKLLCVSVRLQAISVLGKLLCVRLQAISVLGKLLCVSVRLQAISVLGKLLRACICMGW